VLFPQQLVVLQLYAVGWGVWETQADLQGSHAGRQAVCWAYHSSAVVETYVAVQL
jgi:hypothetical protein